MWDSEAVDALAVEAEDLILVLRFGNLNKVWIVSLQRNLKSLPANKIVKKFKAMLQMFFFLGLIQW